MTNVIALVLGASIDTEDSYFVLDAGPGPPTHGSKADTYPVAKAIYVHRIGKKPTSVKSERDGLTDRYFSAVPLFRYTFLKQ